MVLVRLALLSACIASAADLSIEIGSPVAANAQAMKTGLFSVRVRGCSDPALVKVMGEAVRIEGETRLATPLTVGSGSAPGSFVVGTPRVTPPWIAVLTADCAGQKAGAIIPIDARGAYNREGARFFPHAPTDVEINAVPR